MTDLLTEIREVLKRDHVTFAELSRIEGFKGEYEIGFTEKNIVLWTGVSKAGVEAVNLIREEGEYELSPTGLLTYLIDGCHLGLPIAKRSRKYTKPHWLPCIFQKK